jgi:hypothetical protein
MAVGRLTAVKVEPEKRFLARRHELTPAALVYVLADGSESQSLTFTIRSLKVGNNVVQNVRASVADGEDSEGR